MFESCRGRTFRLASPIPTRHRPINTNTSWDVSEPVAGRLAVTDTVTDGACVFVAVGALVVVVVVALGVVVVVVLVATDHWAYRVTLADNVRLDSAAMSSPVPSVAVFHPMKL